MTRDDIIRMAAKETGFGDVTKSAWSEFLNRFAAPVAAAEREACAEICERLPRDVQDCCRCVRLPSRNANGRKLRCCDSGGGVRHERQPAPRKGAAGERELARILSEQLGWVVKRNIGQARDGGDDITTGQFRWGCKRRAKLSVYEFMDQVEAKACRPGDIPIVAMRAGRQELAGYDEARGRDPDDPRGAAREMRWVRDCAICGTLGTTQNANRRNTMTPIIALRIAPVIDIVCDAVDDRKNYASKRQLMQRIRDVKSELYALERELSCVQIGVAAPYRYDAQEVPAWLRRDDGNGDSSDDRKGR
jgi:hypothetical protein